MPCVVFLKVKILFSSKTKDLNKKYKDVTSKQEVEAVDLLLAVRLVQTFCNKQSIIKEKII